MGKRPQTPQRKFIILPAQRKAYISQMQERNHGSFAYNPAPAGSLTKCKEQFYGLWRALHDSPQLCTLYAGFFATGIDSSRLQPKRATVTGGKKDA
ncbi:MAG: hypothetical protein H7844_12225 [Nitrospirae bacterium YQR-1]